MATVWLLIMLMAAAGMLIYAAEILVDQLEVMVKRFKMNTFVLASLLAAFSTSIPELVVSVTASINKDSSLALANVIGSNVANISIILGGAALLAGMLRAGDKIIKSQMALAFLLGISPALFLIDGHIYRLEGLFLLALYGMYVAAELKRKKTIETETEARPFKLKRLFVKLRTKVVKKSLVQFVMAVVTMIGAGQVVVWSAERLAANLQLPVFLVGVLLVAVGTSLPELAFEVAAIKRKETNMAFGNILGSVVMNATLVLGLTALINPISIEGEMKSYLLTVMFFVIIFGLFGLLVKTKRRLDRWEGGLLVAIYLLFATIQYWMR